MARVETYWQNPDGSCGYHVEDDTSGFLDISSGGMPQDPNATLIAREQYIAALASQEADRAAAETARVNAAVAAAASSASQRSAARAALVTQIANAGTNAQRAAAMQALLNFLDPVA